MSKGNAAAKAGLDLAGLHADGEGDRAYPRLKEERACSRFPLLRQPRIGILFLSSDSIVIGSMGIGDVLVVRRVFLRLDPEPGDVQRGQEQQGQHRSDDDAAHHGKGHRSPEDLPRDRDQRQRGGSGGQHDRAHPVFGGLDHRRKGRDARFSQILDLYHQDDRVSDQDADQREHAEERYEAKRRVAGEKRDYHADQRQRRDGKHQEQSVEALQLDHQQRCHDEQHQRCDLDDRPLRLAALLDGAADIDGIACRKRFGEFGDFAAQRIDDRRGLGGAIDGGFDGDRWHAVAPPDGRLLQFVMEGCDRRQWDRLAVTAWQLQVNQGFD